MKAQKSERPSLRMDIEALAGKRMGRLLVERAERAGGRIYVHVVCDCGTRKRIMLDNFRNNTRSCGCASKTYSGAEISRESLKRHFFYDKETGNFYRKIPSGRHRTDSPVGSIIDTGDGKRYRYIDFGGKKHRAHRLVWMYFYGDFPDGQIDHINGDGTDNRIENLRLATNLTNGRNQRLSTNNTSGFNGVTFDRNRKKWIAQICVLGKNKHLGRFDNFDEAVMARRRANEYYGFFKEHGSERPL